MSTILNQDEGQQFTTQTIYNDVFICGAKSLLAPVKCLQETFYKVQIFKRKKKKLTIFMSI